MSGSQSDDGFNKERADLFEALGHPLRLEILSALSESPLGFADLKRKVNVTCSGHLTHHLEKLGGLVMTTPDGLYMLSDDGREARRIIEAAGDYAVRRREGRRVEGRIVMSRAILAAFVAALVFLGSAAVYQQWELSTQGPEMIGNLMSYTYPASASVTSNATGLELSLNISATMITSGGAVQVTVDERNTLPSTNNLTSAAGSPFPGAEPFPISIFSPPTSLAMYRGYYTLDNVSAAEPLIVTARQTSTVATSVRYFVFQPYSDNASAFAYWRPPGSSGWEPMGNLWTRPVEGTSSFSGTYPDYNFDERTLGAFTPGTYTVAAGDEWGQLVLLHFVVIPAPSSNTLWNALTSSPYLLILALLVAACAGASYFLLKRRAMRRRQSDGLLEPTLFEVS